jgi:hypothetical protein
MNTRAQYMLICVVGFVVGALVVWGILQMKTTPASVTPSVSSPITQTPTPAPSTPPLASPPSTPTSTQAAQGTCPALTVLNPVSRMEAYLLPLKVRVMVDNRNPNCHWTVFEAQAGSVELRDRSGHVITSAPLKTTGDWTSNQPLEYDATLSPSTNATGPLVVFITEENPRGKPNPQTVTVNVNVSGFAQ